MKSTKLKKPIAYYSRYIVLAALLAITVWVLCLDSSVTIHEHDPFTTVNTDWSQSIDGVLYPLDVAQDAVAPADGSAIILERTISIAAENRSLLFYASHQTVYIYIDDILVYDLTCPEELASFQSPGQTWVEVPIQSDSLGKTLRLELSSSFSQYQTAPSTLYYVPYNQIQTVQVDYMWLRTILALSVFTLALITYVNASLWKSPKLRRFLFSLADVYLFSSLWICGETNVLSILLGHTALSSIFAMIFLRIVPIVFAQLISAMLVHAPPWLNVLKGLAWANLIGSVLLQLFCGVSLVSSLTVTMVIYAISCVVYIVNFFLHWHGRRYIHAHEKVYYATIIFPLFSLFEVYLNLTQTFGELSGFFASIACIVYAIITHIYLVKNESETAMAKLKLEQTQNALEKNPLHQQINAHFLYNTLNTISAYCKEDPVKADKAVGLLSQYMRRYTHLTAAGEYVPFKNELELIHLYIEILNLRYNEEIALQLDIDFDDFVVPPLTLQPLIENAVRHGLHHFVSDGKLKISTRRYGGVAEVIVSDNGQGFNVHEASTGVGLRNLTRRLRAMGGDLKIDSRPGRGTDVILRVPPPRWK